MKMLSSQVLKYLSITEDSDIPWALIQASLSSIARTAIIPMQDILGLGTSARMNIPATQVIYMSMQMNDYKKCFYIASI